LQSGFLGVNMSLTSEMWEGFTAFKYSKLFMQSVTAKISLHQDTKRFSSLKKEPFFFFPLYFFFCGWGGGGGGDTYKIKP
jgi:hypothetical protein